MNLNYKQVKEAKNNLNYPSDLFISGKYVKSISEKTFESISPIDGQIINNVSSAQKECINLAFLKARDVFDRGHWSNLAPAERKKYF